LLNTFLKIKHAFRVSPFQRKILGALEVANIKVHENRSGWNLVVACGQT
jgi:hypothetical protein